MGVLKQLGRGTLSVVTSFERVDDAFRIRRSRGRQLVDDAVVGCTAGRNPVDGTARVQRHPIRRERAVGTPLKAVQNALRVTAAGRCQFIHRATALGTYGTRATS